MTGVRRGLLAVLLVTAIVSVTIVPSFFSNAGAAVAIVLLVVATVGGAVLSTDRGRERR